MILAPLSDSRVKQVIKDVAERRYAKGPCAWSRIVYGNFCWSRSRPELCEYASEYGCCMHNIEHCK